MRSFLHFFSYDVELIHMLYQFPFPQVSRMFSVFFSVPDALFTYCSLFPDMGQRLPKQTVGQNVKQFCTV